MTKEDKQLVIDALNHYKHVHLRAAENLKNMGGDKNDKAAADHIGIYRHCQFVIGDLVRSTKERV